MVVPSGSSNPIGGAQSMSPLLRSNSGILAAAQAGQMPLMSPRTQYNNTMNVSSLLGQSFANGVSNSEPDPASSVGNGMGFNPSSSSFIQSNQLQGQHFSSPPDQQLEPQNFQQQQYNALRGSFGPVKIEPQNLNSVKLEPHQIQQSRNMVPIKMEPQNSISEQSLFHQQQQQQQILQMSRQSSQAAQMNFLQQQRFLQLPQHQQQQILKSIPQQRSLVPQQFSQSNMSSRSHAKPVFEPGMCARRLTHYMCQQQHRPEDNNIGFWRKFVAEYFATNAKKKWCVSMYGSGRQTTGVFPEDVWHCEICNRKPGRGFEATAEVLPRLFKIKYESGTLEELLYVDMPREYPNTSGQYVLDYAKAIQESVFEQLRVVREGQLRIVFSPDLKICSWEFCARRHEELIPRRLLMPQVGQIAAAAKKYHTATQNASSSLSAQELQNNCNMFVASARQLTKALEVPLVNDLGYTKRYVRCLQISEVVNSMKDLIDYSREKEIGPIDSLAKYPRRSIFHTRPRQLEEQLQNHHPQNPNIDQASPAPTMQQIMASSANSINTINTPQNALNPAITPPISTSASTATIANLLHQNSINGRQSNGFHNPNPNMVTQFQNPNPNMVTQFQNPNTGLGMGMGSDESSSQSSVQKIIHEMMMSNGGSLGNDAKIAGSNSNGGMGMNWRVGMSREQAGGSDLMGGLGSVNGFNNLQFDWKSASP